MNEADEVRKLMIALRKEMRSMISRSGHLRPGTITGINNDGTVMVTMDGNTSIKASVLKSGYTNPKSGDSVEVSVRNGYAIVHGATSVQHASNGTTFKPDTKSVHFNLPGQIASAANSAWTGTEFQGCAAATGLVPATEDMTITAIALGLSNTPSSNVTVDLVSYSSAKSAYSVQSFTVGTSLGAGGLPYTYTAIEARVALRATTDMWGVSVQPWTGSGTVPTGLTGKIFYE